MISLDASGIDPIEECLLAALLCIDEFLAGKEAGKISLAKMNIREALKIYKRNLAMKPKEE